MDGFGSIRNLTNFLWFFGLASRLFLVPFPLYPLHFGRESIVRCRYNLAKKMNTKSRQVRNMLGCCARDQKIWRYHEIPIRLGTTTTWTEMTTIFHYIWASKRCHVNQIKHFCTSIVFESILWVIRKNIPWVYPPLKTTREKLGWSLGSPRLPNGIQTSIWPKQKHKKNTYS